MEPSCKSGGWGYGGGQTGRKLIGVRGVKRRPLNSYRHAFCLCITLLTGQVFLSKFCPTNPTGSCTNDLEEVSVTCTATVETHGQTGVEMEALTAVQVALLTVYDMCKAVDRGTTINGVKLMEKHGGKSGSFVAD